MNIITSADRNWAIGKDNNLLISIPEDMKFFKNKTLQKIVIMGKNTLESLPNSKPLPNRINIVLTSDKHFKKSGVIICHSVQNVIEILGAAIKRGECSGDDIFVIGGESIFKQFLPYCRKAYITRIEKEFEADKYFPENLEKSSEWEKVNSVKYYSESAKVVYYFEEYKRIHKNRF